MINDIFDLFSVANILLALTATIMMVRLAIRHPKARVLYILESLFCAYSSVLYTYILIANPTIGQETAALGRVGLTLLLGGLIALGIIVDK